MRRNVPFSGEVILIVTPFNLCVGLVAFSRRSMAGLISCSMGFGFLCIIIIGILRDFFHSVKKARWIHRVLPLTHSPLSQCGAMCCLQLSMEISQSNLNVR